ncbi:Sjogren's syndrome/scleroderma autoantigen 1 family protein [Methanopyrus sp. SNP6]|uniref:Sjogren's syndrome/scleroderma autoantigen 1 family protein n=1 Tax=Methanopyrus sp. SNP6 TaxID=1937005 RepID=UPI0011E5E3D8|nr:Sjogren's syndrome/scleroderma autoantigen 1 family protein [Methanopyrus sp. SNP6]
MAERLLAGHKMLGIHCPECKVPLFQDPKTGTVSCPICGTEFEVIEEEKAEKVKREAKERRKRAENGKRKTKRVKKKLDSGKEEREPEKEKQKRRQELRSGEDVQKVVLQVVTTRLKRAAETKDPEHALRELEVAEKALEILKKL